jgi:hypothetical protein
MLPELGRRAVESRAAKLFLTGPRTTTYMIRSMSRAFRADRQRRPEIPTQLTTPGLVASVLVDEVALAFMPTLGSGLDRTQLTRVRDETDRALALFQAKGWLADPLAYHRAPPPPHAVSIRQRRYGYIRYEHLMFESLYEPPADMPGAGRWAPTGPNADVHAFVLRHRGSPRPWLVSLHGLHMGKPMDLVGMRALHWFGARGFNVILPVAPLHGPRADGTRNGTNVISLDYLDNVHALSQALWDIRRCLQWVREQGAPTVTIHGISMGGFLASLVAGIDDGVDRVVAGMPLVDVGGLAARAPRHVRRLLDECRLTDQQAEQLHRVISPLAFPCQVDHDARFVYAGVGDRFTTAGQAYQLWKHWDEPAVLWYSGSHIADWAGQKKAFLDRAIGSAAATPAARRA